MRILVINHEFGGLRRVVVAANAHGLNLEDHEYTSPDECAKAIAFAMLTAVYTR